MKINLHKGHRARVRARYINSGLDSFEDHEVLELLLYYCYPQIDTNEIAHKMIRTFGSLHNLFGSNPLDIMKECNVTENVAVLVSLTPDLSKRYSIGRWGKKEVLNTTADLGAFAKTLFAGYMCEYFHVICLDSQNQLLKVEMIREGTVDAVEVYIREVVEIAFRHKASGVVLAHNHPSGYLKASKKDIEITKSVAIVLTPMKITLVDHIIVGGKKYLSFIEENIPYMPPPVPRV